MAAARRARLAVHAIRPSRTPAPGRA